MQDRERWIDSNYALISAGVLAIILYGSLYPFQFHNNAGANGPFRALVQTWHAPIHRGDFIANILLYLPFGLFFACPSSGGSRS
jgi:hypothetical protein